MIRTLSKRVNVTRLGRSIAVLTVMVLFDFSQKLLSYFHWYVALYDHFPYYVPEGIKSAIQVIAAVGALRLLGVPSLRRTLSELGVFSSLWRGALFGFGAAIVMFIGFATMMQFRPVTGALSLIYLAGISPLAEEAVFRAFGVGTLRYRCGAPLWLALLLPALLFGWGHVGGGSSFTQNAGLFSLTTAGGVFFGWFYLRWQRNLWVPFFIHAAMNLSWELFNVSSNALGGWFPFVLQLGAILIGVLATVRFTSPGRLMKADPPAV